MKATIPYSLRRGFTLVEVLVVITIIVVLVAILLPSVSFVRSRANKAATQALLTSISQGLEQYNMDFLAYPPSLAGSSPFNGVSGFNNNGGLMLAEGLTGYLDSSADGAGPATGDPVYGFRIRTGGNGKIYGPYASPGGANWKVTDAQHQVFIDRWGQEILYYRAVPTTMNNLRRTITTVFGSAGAAQDSTFTAYFGTDDNSAIATPPSGTAQPPDFWPLIGCSSNSNTFNSGDIILGDNSFLLVSAGADGAYFTSDDIVLGGNK